MEMTCGARGRSCCRSQEGAFPQGTTARSDALHGGRFPQKCLAQSRGAFPWGNGALHRLARGAFPTPSGPARPRAREGEPSSQFSATHRMRVGSDETYSEGLSSASESQWCTSEA